MKIRFSATGVTFRITPEELATLGQGAALVQHLQLAGTRVSFALQPQAVAPPDAACLRAACDADGVQMTLAVTAGDVAALAALGKDKEGLSFEQGDLAVRLQVDLRAVPHPRKD